MLQSVISLFLPRQCVMCDAQVESEGGLCGACWTRTPFIEGLSCDLCGVPLTGEDDGHPCCDECLAIPRPWSGGRAALVYRDVARRLVLALKHGDRIDLVAPASQWMAQAAKPLLERDSIFVPIPAHWLRLVARRYNQAALLAQAVAQRTGHECMPRALLRPVRTSKQDGKSRDQRFADLDGAIVPDPKRGAGLAGRHVILVDDVMTSGATFSAAAEACFEAGARRIDVLALARVTKSP